MPIGSRGAPVFVAGIGLSPRPMTKVYVPTLQPNRYVITGVTRDSSGAALGNCTVEVYETATDLARMKTVSDANGNYQIEVTGGFSFYLVAYLAGSPDRAGTTINTITGV